MLGVSLLRFQEEAHLSPRSSTFAPWVSLSKHPSEKSAAPVSSADAAAAIAREMVASQSRLGLKAPTLLTIYPDLYCQQRCDFCFLTQSDKGIHSITRSTALPAQPWQRLLREAKELGVAGISLLGGEPTLYPGLGDIIETCSELGLSLGITSNGLRVPAPIVDLLRESPTTMLCLSLESTSPELHKLHTGVDNRPVIKTMRMLHDEGIDYNVNTIGLGQSYEDLCGIADLCAELGARVWFFNLYYTKELHPRSFPGYEWYGEMDARLREYTSRKRSDLAYQMFGCQLYWSRPPSDLLRPSAATEYNRLIRGCAAGINQLEILPDGTALPCMQMDLETFECGNVFDLGLHQVWSQSPVLNELRKKLVTDHSTCGQCSFVERCRGGCPERQRVTMEAVGESIDHLCPHLPTEVSVRLERQR